MSQARTAGRAFRVWQIQRQLDSDVDGLSASQQQDLGRFLARTGGDGRQTYADLRAVDSDAADTLAAIDDPVTQRQFVNAYQRGEVDGDELATALRQYDEMSPVERAIVRESAAEANGETIRLLTVDVCNSPCDDPVSAAVELGRERSELTNTQAKQLAKAVREGKDVSSGPGGDPSEVMETLNELADSDNVDNFDDAVGSISGTESGYKGIAGEADVAKRKLDNGADEVTMEEKVGRNDLDEDRIEDSDLDRDKDLLEGVEEGTSKTDIDAKADGTAYESKNVNFEPYADNPNAYIVLGRDLNNLRRKLNTVAASGEDDIVVVVRKGQLQKSFDSDMRAKFPPGLKDVDSLEKLGKNVEENFDDVDVTFKTYDEVK